jgi:hypothetical protein
VQRARRAAAHDAILEQRREGRPVARLQQPDHPPIGEEPRIDADEHGQEDRGDGPGAAPEEGEEPAAERGERHQEDREEADHQHAVENGEHRFPFHGIRL